VKNAEKLYLLLTESGQPAVQSDDKECILELKRMFSKGAHILKRGDDGQYHNMPLLEQEG
jgi:hypothetical protein